MAMASCGVGIERWREISEERKREGRRRALGVADWQRSSSAVCMTEAIGGWVGSGRITSGRGRLLGEGGTCRVDRPKNQGAAAGIGDRGRGVLERLADPASAWQNI